MGPVFSPVKLPGFLKLTARFVFYKNQRRKVFREVGIRKAQDTLIQEQHDANAKKLIVFLVPGADWETGIDKISGGVISIVSICEETLKLKSIHGAEVILCTMPGQHLFLKHTQFTNSTPVYRFEQLHNFFRSISEVIFHVPEFLCDQFLEYVRESDEKWLKQIRNVHINILNQNIRLMPSQEVIEEFKARFHFVTSTTAHQQYCTLYYRNHFGIPVHKFSVWISPEKYIFKHFNEKENLIIVSPDEHSMRAEIIEKLTAIDGLKIQVIQNLTYDQYKETISRAKWAITFGEGLDGYFIEPVFSGAIGFAVYNEEFFTQDFESLQTIYPSYEVLLTTIGKHIALLSKEEAFTPYQQQQYHLCARYYSKDEYRNNIAAFYRQEYTYG